VEKAKPKETGWTGSALSKRFLSIYV
jgi:hypothetical protein